MAIAAGSSKERVAVLPLDRGLFVVRYVSSRAARPPSVFVRPSPSCEGSVEIISAPGNAPGVLEQVGECVIVLAPGSGSLQVTVSSKAPDGDLDASVRIEPLVAAEFGRLAAEAISPPALRTPINPASSAARRNADFKAVYSGFAMTAHVARRGDLLVRSGEWAGGPSAPAPIEGLLINWSPPAGVALEYQVPGGRCRGPLVQVGFRGRVRGLAWPPFAARGGSVAAGRGTRGRLLPPRRRPVPRLGSRVRDRPRARIPVPCGRRSARWPAARIS